MMKFNTIVYSIKQGVKNISRNKMFSLASIGTMVACLFLFGVFFAVVMNINYMMKEMEGSVCLTVFFDKGTTTERIEEIGNEIVARAEVKEVVYVSPEEAWQNFSADFFEGHEELISGFEGDNPLKDSDSYKVYVNDVNMQNALADYISKMEGVRQVNNSESTVKSLISMNSLVTYASAGIIVTLFLVSLFLIINTITIGISVRKEEIAIMKLIGATDFFVRAPFFVEGLIIGFIGALVPMGFLYIMYNKVVEYVISSYGMIAGFIKFLPVKEVFVQLLPVALFLGMGVGFIGSMVTVRKHLSI